MSERLGPIRRVVTGHDDSGHSVIERNSVAPQRFDSPDVPGFGATVAWWENDVIDLSSIEDKAGADAEIPMSPPVGGSIFRIADFPPDSAYSDEAIERLFSSIRGEHHQQDGATHGDSRHFWFHRTNSLDYAIVLSGEIVLMVDEGETTLRTGDVAIQRATNHSWSNRSDQVCRMLFVLLGTPPASPAEIVAARESAQVHSS